MEDKALVGIGWFFFWREHGGEGGDAGFPWHRHPVNRTANPRGRPLGGPTSRMLTFLSGYSPSNGTSPSWALSIPTWLRRPAAKFPGAAAVSLATRGRRNCRRRRPLMHAMIAINILVEGGAVLTGIALAVVGEENGGGAGGDLRFLRNHCFLCLTNFLSGRGVPAGDVWNWRAVTSPGLLLPVVGGHGGAGAGNACARLPRAAVPDPRTAEFIHKSQEQMAGIPGLRIWYAVMAVAFAPFAEYLFRGCFSGRWTGVGRLARGDWKRGLFCDLSSSAFLVAGGSVGNRQRADFQKNRAARAGGNPAHGI